MKKNDILVEYKNEYVNINVRYSALSMESDLCLIKIAALDQFLGVADGMKRPVWLVGCYFGTCYPPK